MHRSPLLSSLLPAKRRSLSMSVMALLLMVLTLSACAAPASAPENETPDRAADRLYSASRHGDFGAHLDTMAPALRTVVARDNACASEHDACEITMDPWLTGGGQEGGIDGKPSFNTIAEDPGQARVRMDYVYAWSATQKEPQTTCVVLTRSAPDSPWLLADLVPACEDGRSLLGQLKQAYP